MSFSKINIASSVKRFNNFDLSRKHLTTLDFGSPTILFNEALVPGDKYKVWHTIFSRLAPLVFPSYVDAYLCTQTFFVPYYLVDDSADSFMSGTTLHNGNKVVNPLISTKDLQLAFTKYSKSLSTMKRSDFISSKIHYDFYITDTSGNNVTPYLFTKYGRSLYRIIKSLGYDLVNYNPNHDAFPLNAYPLLCFFRAFNDWLSQYTKYNASAVSNCLHHIQHHDTPKYIGADGYLTLDALSVLFSNIVPLYDNDYFTTAWSEPYRPDSSVDDIIQTYAEGSSYFNTLNNVEAEVNDTREDIVNPSSQFTGPTEQTNKLLGLFDSFVRRNGYTGSRAVERIYNFFGVKPSDFNSQFSLLINSTRDKLSIGDVTNTSDSPADPSTSNVLGGFAGRGFFDSRNSFEFTSKDFGQLITIAYIVPKVSYIEGLSPEVTRTRAFDFFNPNFDGKTIQAIPITNLSCGRLNSEFTPSETTLNQVFGFVNKYDDYRVSFDQVTGDFLLYPDFSSWHFGRLFGSSFSNLRAQSPTFVQQNDSTQFDRIFSVTEPSSTPGEDVGSVDHFYLSCYFKVSATRPMVTLSQSTGIPEGNLTIDRNGSV